MTEPMSTEGIAVSFCNDVMLSPLNAATLYERVRLALKQEREACAAIALRGCGECEHLATEPCRGNGLSAGQVVQLIRARA